MKLQLRVTLRPVAIACLVAVATAKAPAGETLQANLPYTAEAVDPVRYEVDFSAVVTAPYHTKVLKVWLPIPQSDTAQQVTASRLSTFPMEVMPQIAAEETYGNKFAYFEFRNPKGAQIIRHRFTATVNNMRWNVDPKLVRTPKHWPEPFEKYLQPQPIALNDHFQAIVGNLARQGRPSTADLFGAIEWVDENLTYDHQDASLQADAAHAFIKRHGHCSDYHSLCATMGRTLGAPTRMTYGLALYPKNSPSHCKFEAFIPPYGWVSFDVSETQKMVAKIRQDESLTALQKTQLADAARQRLLAGFRENSWLLVTKGTNYELAPPAARPVKVVRTIYAEADGEALPEPDPANEKAREYGWMTVHQYKANQPVVKPFKDFSTLQP